MLWGAGAGAGAEVCTKIGGSGMVLAREGAGGCEFRVVCGRSPMLAKSWFTAARAVLVIVSTNWCVAGGEKSSFKGVGARDACDPNAGVCVGSRRGGGLVGVQYYFKLSSGVTVGLFHRSGRGRGKNALLSSDIGSRRRSHAGFPSRSRCPKLGPS